MSIAPAAMGAQTAPAGGGDTLTLAGAARAALAVLESASGTVVETAPGRYTGVEAVIVRFSVDQAPASIDESPSVVLLNGSAVSLRDTTESNGRASRVARLRLRTIANAAGTPGQAFSTTTLSPNSTVRVLLMQLSAGLQPLAQGALRGGLSVNVPVTSGNTAVGTITTSSL